LLALWWEREDGPNDGLFFSWKMTDVLTRTQRSRNMAAIRSKDTKPEITVRQLLHRIGYRYVLHDGRLPPA
jgi:DNA mismatch endonuclease (patch repair protein)